MTIDIAWTIGGPQGSGIDVCARIFGTLCARKGFFVYGKREYYSNIKGAHSYFQIRFSEKIVRSGVSRTHYLMALDSETIVRHIVENGIHENGILFYDPKVIHNNIYMIPSLDDIVIEKAAKLCREHNLDKTVAALLKIAESKNIRCESIDYEKIMDEISQELNIRDQTKLTLLKNTIILGVSAKVLGFQFADLKTILEEQFKDKSEKVIKMNVLAAEKSYNSQPILKNLVWTISGWHSMTTERRLFIPGTTAVALGKIAGGCRFQVYYPITPATDESEFLEENAEYGVVVVQAEDELAAACMAIGGALTGTRSATSTSGPGFSLMTEAIGWAGINEVPVVICNYQRAGPSTGLPTRHEQGDLLFSIFGSHGEFARIVLAPGDIEESFYYTIEAFNFAERFQLPVILLMDKNLANNAMVIPDLNLDKVKIDRGKLATLPTQETGNKGEITEPGEYLSEEYLRFKITPDGISPRAVVGQTNTIFWNTGDEHTEKGHITENVVIRNKMMEKRLEKYNLINETIESSLKCTVYGSENGEIGVVSWGSTKGVILDVLEKWNNKKIKFIQIRVIHPFPVKEFLDAVKTCKKLIIIEQNYSAQLGKYINQNCNIKFDTEVVKYNGRPIMEDELMSALNKAITDKVSRIVLTEGI